MTDPTHADAATQAARHGLIRNYQQVFELVRRRARGGDVVAHGFERELTHAYLPPPTHLAVRRWLAAVAAERALFNRASDPWIARQLLADMQAWETRAPAISAWVWAEVVATVRAGPHA